MTPSTPAGHFAGIIDLLCRTVAALSFDVEDGRPIPRPSAARGRPIVSADALETTKLALHDAMLAAGLSNVELGRKLGLDEKSVRRLRAPLHRSHIGAVEAASRALGKRVEVNVMAAG